MSSHPARKPLFTGPAVVSSMVATLKLQNLIKAILSTHYARLPQDTLKQLLVALEMSVSYAHDWNLDMPLRTVLWDQFGFMTDRPVGSSRYGAAREARGPVRLPHLLEQETLGCSYLLTVMIAHLDDASCIMRSESVDRFEAICVQVFRRYTTAEQTVGTVDEDRDALEEEIRALVPVVEQGLRAIRDDLTPVMFCEYLPWIFPLLTDLCRCRNHQVHGLVADILKDRIGGMLPLERR